LLFTAPDWARRHVKASEDSGDLAAKIAILNDGLKTLGYKEVVIVYEDIAAGYDPSAAKKIERNH
jgi:hypothetical protein